MSKREGRAGDGGQIAPTSQPGIFPRVPGDQPASYPDQSPPGNAWTIYNYREQRCYWHFGRPAEWAEAVQRDFDPEGLTVAERRRKDQQRKGTA